MNFINNKKLGIELKKSKFLKCYKNIKKIKTVLRFTSSFSRPNKSSKISSFPFSAPMWIGARLKRLKKKFHKNFFYLNVIKKRQIKNFIK